MKDKIHEKYLELHKKPGRNLSNRLTRDKAREIVHAERAGLLVGEETIRK